MQSQPLLPEAAITDTPFATALLMADSMVGSALNEPKLKFIIFTPLDTA